MNSVELPGFIFIRNVNDRLYLNVNQLVLKVTDQEEWFAS